MKANKSKSKFVYPDKLYASCDEVCPIDSLQEEPVIEDLLDMTKIDNKIQYASIDDGIHAHAEDYSFNIESELFNQLTKEQQVLWQKEIEQAAISGGHCGVELARDKRYEENREPVSEELEEAAMEWFNSVKYKSDLSGTPINTFKAGAKWQKENLWKPADGDDLPEYDREVIAIVDYDFGHYKVVYAHRPNPDGWNGTNIDTGEKERFEPVIYDKGGWNQPHILYWLDARLPYEENKIDK